MEKSPVKQVETILKNFQSSNTRTHVLAADPLTRASSNPPDLWHHDHELGTSSPR